MQRRKKGNASSGPVFSTTLQTWLLFASSQHRKEPAQCISSFLQVLLFNFWWPYLLYHSLYIRVSELVWSPLTCFTQKRCYAKKARKNSKLAVHDMNTARKLIQEQRRAAEKEAEDAQQHRRGAKGKRFRGSDQKNKGKDKKLKKRRDGKNEKADATAQKSRDKGDDAKALAPLQENKVHDREDTSAREGRVKEEDRQEGVKEKRRDREEKALMHDEVESRKAEREAEVIGDAGRENEALSPEGGGEEEDIKGEEAREEKDTKKKKKKRKRGIKGTVIPRSSFESKHPSMVYVNSGGFIIDFPTLRFAGRDAMDQCYIVEDDEWINLPNGW